MTTALPKPSDFEVSVLGYEPAELIKAAGDCMASGGYVDAETLLRAAATKRPQDAETRYRLAGAQIALGKLEEAQRTLAEARDLHGRLVIQTMAPKALAPDASTADLVEAAEMLYANNQMAAATHVMQRLMEMHPAEPGLRLKLGLALQHQGRMDEAIATYEGALRHWPSAEDHSYLHYARAFQRATPDAMLQEGLRWVELHAPKTQAPRPPALHRPDGRLRIGYFAPLFNQHQLSKFIQPVLEHHDRTRFSVVCYSGAPAGDDTAKAIKAGADLWREVELFDDDAFARQVVEDKIDVLVDLWGHTAGSRLLLFARKPAPIQLSWINYVETTGLTQFDYVLHADGYSDLPDAQDLYSETILPIGPIVAPYRPSHDIPPPNDTPMLTSGAMTFGCFGHPAKITLEVIATWASILEALPEAKLVLRSVYFDDLPLKRTIWAQFDAFGIGAGRIVFPPFASGKDFLLAYHAVDLILDPFPYQGLTTTLDAISSGVPVLTWRGDHMHNRIAAVTLRACGLDELVCESREAYVQTAIDLAGDPQRLNALRARVRPGFDASAYRDEVGFTRRYETALEVMADAYRPG
ncbi:putative O-linked N-acetylglucosamine transferase, SPINDLY family [Caulobacter sp. AP07]|uniref:O-linked N-acetylglucosamine transferase, SPINDLY family protein n=1 Tax=Caulobacter sp. AP07 TaxID=1144304 RepID=UPI00027200ED|nr:tetratricopeptide repeat protein [Caulobacter sp. AP07]EJL38188.1 putative O-linked N-acetylglucosamine transferase, SPINDLY family [Caulobacter sp. AP07]